MWLHISKYVTSNSVSKNFFSNIIRSTWIWLARSWINQSWITRSWMIVWILLIDFQRSDLMTRTESKRLRSILLTDFQKHDLMTKTDWKHLLRSRSHLIEWTGLKELGLTKWKKLTIQLQKRWKTHIKMTVLIRIRIMIPLRNVSIRILITEKSLIR